MIFSACRLTAIFLLFMFVSPVSPFSESFTPNTLRISAPTGLQYYFDGNKIEIPFTLIGAPAAITLLIVRDHSPANHVRNGYLGWHYMNQVDTCEYISASKQYSIGHNIIEWNGKNQDGNNIPSDVYSYIIWGYDHTSPGQPVSNFLRPNRGDRSLVVTNDKAGIPLAAPVWYDAPRHFSSSTEQSRKIRTRWIIGSDTSDLSQLETCSYPSWTDNSALALYPGDDQRFFIQTLRPDGNLVLRMYRWVPNGEAVLQTDWGKGGEVPYQTTIPPDNAWYSGPVSDGLGYLFFTDADISGSGRESNIVYVDSESGDIVARRDLSGQWIDPELGATGPTNLSFAGGWLLCTAPSSCLFQMINPYGEYNDNAVIWENGNGDGVGDKNYGTTWDCSDPFAPPFVHEAVQENNHFTVFPADGLSNTSFGVFAQDGKGLGYFPLAEEGIDVTAIKIIDYGSPYDGMYYSGTSEAGGPAGWKYVSQDFFVGHMAAEGDMYPWLWYQSPENGAVLTPNMKYQIRWLSHAIDLVDIEFSADGGLNWIPIGTNISGSGNNYLWTVPNINAVNCKVRLTGRWYTGHGNTMLSTTVTGDAVFTISGPTGVSDRADAAPRPCITATNRPNPFNPSTTIQYTLGMPGTVTLSVYDTLGQQIVRLGIGKKDRGTYEFIFDGQELSSGLYFYRITTEYATVTGKMLLVR